MEFASSCTVDELGDYLLEKGVPPDIVTKFIENQIDGECFLELTEGEVKELVKPLGVAKRIIRLIKDVSPPAKQTSPELFQSSQTCVIGSPIPSQSTLSSPIQSDISSQATPTDRDFVSTFKIPSKWRPTIMKAIETEKLTPDLRNEIVRDLVTHMYGYTEKPTTNFCKFAAQRLILKYQFMRDTKGTGYGSWEKKLCDRVSNVLRKRKMDTDADDCTPRKRGRPKKAVVSLQDRYPAISYSTVDPDEEKTASDSLQKEMQNRKPRRQVFLPLMKTTFAARRHFILHDATSVRDILRDYPALKMSSAIEQEMELILSRPGVLRSFTTEWTTKWVPAILSYCKRLKKKEVVELLKSSENDEEEKLALTLLLLLFAPKKSSDAMKHLFEKCLIGEDPNVVAAQPPARSSPRFAEFVVEDSSSTYFVFVEQMTVCECSTFSNALFIWFCTHYVFHLSYYTVLADLCAFFQEFIFGLPLTGKRSASYLTTATDIQQLTLR